MVVLVLCLLLCYVVFVVVLFSLFFFKLLFLVKVCCCPVLHCIALRFVVLPNYYRVKTLSIINLMYSL